MIEKSIFGMEEQELFIKSHTKKIFAMIDPFLQKYPDAFDQKESSCQDL